MLPRIYRNEANNRKHQINTLKVFNDNVTEVIEDGEYKIAFKAGVNDFSLHVILSNNFPQEKPVIKVSPIIIHHWVNAEGEVTAAPGLLNFSVHSDLGRVVQAIIREFERNPPPLATECNNALSRLPTSRDENNSSYAGLNNFSPTPLSNATIFSELNNLTTTELETLNENLDWQCEIIEQQPNIKAQNDLLDDMIINIEEAAKDNLTKQKVQIDLKQNIENRLEEVEKLAFENERLHNQYLSLSEKYIPRNIQKQLKSSSQKADSASEQIADSFLRGELDVDAFIAQYMKARTLCQLRKTKEEKLGQQLEKLEKARY